MRVCSVCVCVCTACVRDVWGKEECSLFFPPSRVGSLSGSHRSTTPHLMFLAPSCYLSSKNVMPQRRRSHSNKVTHTRAGCEWTEECHTLSIDKPVNLVTSFLQKMCSNEDVVPRASSPSPWPPTASGSFDHARPATSALATRTMPPRATRR
jgi:hypothetical protein